MNNPVRFLNIKEAIEKTSLSRSTIYRLERAGLFPPRRKISLGRIAWVEAEVAEWLSCRAVGRSQGVSA